MNATEPRESARDDRRSLVDLPLHEVVDSFSFGFVLTDRDGVVLDANQAAETLFGIQRLSLLGKPIASLVPREYRRTMRSALGSIARDQAAFTWAQEVQPRSGEPALVEITAVPVSSAQGSFVAFAVQDVRDRAALERRLRMLTGDLEALVLERTESLETERARLAAVMRQIPAGLVIVDAPDGNVVSVNDEALRMLRMETSESASAWQGWRMDGTPYAEDELPLFRSRVKGEVVSGERIEVAAGDGSRVVLDVNSAPARDVAGVTIGAVCVFTDVTARERRERVEREFVTNAAHELQSPLAALVSSVEVLMAGAKDTPERDLFLDHVAREAERLTRLVRALLVLARAQMGAEPPMMEIVPVAPILGAIADQLALPASVTVTVSCPDDLAALSNAELLEQAVANAAQNAAKYTLGGTIHLDGRRVGDLVEVTIADTGPGIPETEQALVFERFHRAGGEGGSGLGLAIVEAIMGVLGGEVELASEVGAGTTIRVRMPHATTMVST